MGNGISRNPLILSAVIFGSRTIGSHKPYSDIDIAVYGDLDASDLEGIINDLYQPAIKRNAV
jgi:predicted nucleotidyltransferase